MTTVPSGCVPISNAFIVPKTEAQWADQLRRRGVRTTEANGRYWMHVGGLVWRPVHSLARLQENEAVKPYPLCMGFSCPLTQGQRHAANGNLPVHLLADEGLRSYSEKSIHPNKRTQLKRARERAVYAQVVDVAAHVERLYAITHSTIERIGRGRFPKFSKFRSGLIRRVREDRDCLIAGLIDGEIAAYRLLSAVEDVAYFVQTMTDTAYLKSNVGVGLNFESVQLVRRAEGIRYVVSGLHEPKLKSLTAFKESMAFRVTAWPTIHWLSPLLRHYLAWRAPEKLYRITGIRPLG